MISRLDSHHRDWIELKVNEGFEASEVVNSVLLGESGVPVMPQREQVTRLAQAALKKEQVDFMMGAEQGERPVFTYQTKLVAPSERRDLLSALIDGQPKKMDTSEYAQCNLSMVVEGHLEGRPSRELVPTWYWDFGQGDQIIETPQPGDDASLALGRRVREFLKNLPGGMRGTDRFTWSTRMAAGLLEGKPLDVRFSGDAMNIPECETRLFTVLDEEGANSKRANRTLIRGSFALNYRRGPWLGRVYARSQCDDARFRISIDGSTKVLPFEAPVRF